MGLRIGAHLRLVLFRHGEQREPPGAEIAAGKAIEAWVDDPEHRRLGMPVRRVDLGRDEGDVDVVASAAFAVEADARLPAHRAGAAVGADEIGRAQARALARKNALRLHRDTGVAIGEPVEAPCLADRDIAEPADLSPQHDGDIVLVDPQIFFRRQARLRRLGRGFEGVDETRQLMAGQRRDEGDVAHQIWL